MKIHTITKDPQITAEKELYYKRKEICIKKWVDSQNGAIRQDNFFAWVDGYDAAYNQLSTELKQLRAERQWQDISTAPKDGTKILAYLIDNAEHRKSFPENERNGIDIIVWTNHNKGGWISNRFGTPTLWMPLLDKLTDSAQSGEGKQCD